MVDRGLAESREKAQALILAGEVTVNGQKAAKPGHAVDAEAAIEVAARPPYVSRGGFKLAAALRQFAIDPAGKICLDIGASTGGFTDALLQAGAARVYTLAGIIRYAMPYLDPGSLTDEEAQQLAAFINSKPRPAYPFKAQDYSTEKLPPDSVYYPRR